jgi:hypothetical protein
MSAFSIFLEPVVPEPGFENMVFPAFEVEDDHAPPAWLRSAKDLL